jgi:hypothetical protein
MYEVFARIIVAWKVYDGVPRRRPAWVKMRTAVALAESLNCWRRLTPSRARRITVDNVARMPLRIINRIGEEIGRVADPSRPRLPVLRGCPPPHRIDHRGDVGQSDDAPAEWADFILMRRMHWSWEQLQATPLYVRRYCLDTSGMIAEHEDQETKRAQAKRSSGRGEHVGELRPASSPPLRRDQRRGTS